MSDWERVALRVQSNKLRKWDAVCTPQDPDVPDDELPNTLPHLYDHRSRLIREAVEELIAREAGELSDGASGITGENEQIEQDLAVVREDTSEVISMLREVRDLQSEIKQSVVTTDEFTNELFTVLPEFASYSVAFTTVDTEERLEGFEDPNADRADEYGYWRDVAERLNSYSLGQVIDGLVQLENDVVSVEQFRIHGADFFVRVEE